MRYRSNINRARNLNAIYIIFIRSKRAAQGDEPVGLQSGCVDDQQNTDVHVVFRLEVYISQGKGLHLGEISEGQSETL